MPKKELTQGRLTRPLHFLQMDWVVVCLGPTGVLHRLHLACSYCVWPTQYLQKYIWIRCQCLKKQEIAQKNTDFRLPLENSRIWLPWAPRPARRLPGVKIKAAHMWGPLPLDRATLALVRPLPRSPEGGWMVCPLSFAVMPVLLFLLPCTWPLSLGQGFCLDLLGICDLSS